MGPCEPHPARTRAPGVARESGAGWPAGERTGAASAATVRTNRTRVPSTARFEEIGNADGVERMTSPPWMTRTVGAVRTEPSRGQTTELDHRCEGGNWTGKNVEIRPRAEPGISPLPRNRTQSWLENTARNHPDQATPSPEGVREVISSLRDRARRSSGLSPGKVPSGSLTRATSGMYGLRLMTVPASWGRSFLRTAVLVVSIVILLGHTCALPAHSDAGSTAAADDLDHGASHEADGAHIDSCDATMSKCVPPPVAHEAGTPAVVLLSVETAPSVEGGPVLAVASGSPLYLLHASFRI